MTEPAFPEPLQNVRIERADGEVVPLDCAYGGLDPWGSGAHIWRTAVPRWLGAEIAAGTASVQIGVLPGRTSVELDLLES